MLIINNDKLDYLYSKPKKKQLNDVQIMDLLMLSLREGGGGGAEGGGRSEGGGDTRHIWRTRQ